MTSMVLPSDGLCPTCREPFTNAEWSTTVPEGTPLDMAVTVNPADVRGPYFTPCGHDAGQSG